MILNRDLNSMQSIHNFNFHRGSREGKVNRRILSYIIGMCRTITLFLKEFVRMIFSALEQLYVFVSTTSPKAVGSRGFGA